MADKSYKELSKRLGRKKQNSGNFRSYEQISKDVQKDNVNIPKTSNKTSNKTPIKKPKTKKHQPAKVKKKDSHAIYYPNIIALSVLAVVIILCFYGFTNKNAMEVKLNDELIGHVKTKTLTHEELTKTIVERIKQEKGANIHIDDTITLVPVRAKKKHVLSDSDLTNKLIAEVSYKVEAAEISIDGNVIGIVKNMDEAQRIFDTIKNKHIPEEGNVTAEFVEDVKATPKPVREEYINNSEAVQAEFEKDSVLTETYVVKPNDTPSKIAASHGMTLEELDASNPSHDLSKPIQIGMELNVTSKRPFISIRTIETITETVNVPREVSPQSDPDLPAGKTRIIQQGKDGKKEVTIEVVKINGEEISRNQVSEKDIEASEPQIVANGTG